jgi:hypothetical protein
VGGRETEFHFGLIHLRHLPAIHGEMSGRPVGSWDWTSWKNTNYFAFLWFHPMIRGTNHIVVKWGFSTLWVMGITTIPVMLVRSSWEVILSVSVVWFNSDRQGVLVLKNRVWIFIPQPKGFINLGKPFNSILSSI